jgi:hypothetical protein
VPEIQPAEDVFPGEKVRTSRVAPGPLQPLHAEQRAVKFNNRSKFPLKRHVDHPSGIRGLWKTTNRPHSIYHSILCFQKLLAENVHDEPKWLLSFLVQEGTDPILCCGLVRQRLNPPMLAVLSFFARSDSRFFGSSFEIEQCQMLGQVKSL